MVKQMKCVDLTKIEAHITLSHTEIPQGCFGGHMLYRHAITVEFDGRKYIQDDKNKHVFFDSETLEEIFITRFVW
jgi:hypothetical protein